jgi:hypothetical protein
MGLRHDGFDAYVLSDRSVGLTQQYEITGGFSAYLKETAGNGTKSLFIVPFPRRTAAKCRDKLTIKNAARDNTP